MEVRCWREEGEMLCDLIIKSDFVFFSLNFRDVTFGSIS